MATKIFCDGCDGEMQHDKDGARKGIRINTTSQAGEGAAVLGQFAIGPFDLCGRCIEHFKRDVDPRTWPRHAKEERKVA